MAGDNGPGFPDSVSSGDSVSATGNNSLPGGAIGKDKSLSSVTTSGTTPLALDSVTCTLGTGRELRIMCSGQTSGNTLADTYKVSIYEDGSEIQRRDFTVRNTGDARSYSFFVHSHASAGSHTYIVYLVRTGGTGTMTSEVGTNTSSYLVVDDLGTSFT